MSQSDISTVLSDYLKSAQDARPMYRKIADGLALALGSGQATLPSERILSEALGVSRVTVRRAVDDLVADGLLARRRGARTVAAGRLEKALATLTGFSDELRGRGIVPGQVWLSREVTLPTSAEVMALGLIAGARVLRLARVRLANGQPIAVERASVPETILSSGEMVDESLYGALAHHGSAPVRGVQRIRAGVMARADAELLQQRPGAPMLIVERRCFRADGMAVEFTETRYNGESYDFVTELRT